MRLLIVAAMGAASACSGDTPPQIDANPLGPRCSMQVYDLCNEEHDCTSDVPGIPPMCQNFAAEGFQVCTRACNATNPCPDDRTGSPGACAMGICQPAQPNMCHL